MLCLHRKRVLRGTVVGSEPVVMQGAIFLLKDEQGDLVIVSGGVSGRSGLGSEQC